MAVSEKKQFKA